jgi:hypothetical protein
MIISRRRRERGQASVEAALGILVFISVLVFGIRFAEVGYLSIKVLEAEANTRWDATAMKTSLPPNDFTLRDATIASAAGGVQSRYADLDGRASTNAGTSTTQVFVHVDDLALNCNADSVVNLTLPATLTPVFSNGNGGISCQGQATMELLNWFPVNFLDQGPGGIFTVPHADPAGTLICGVGRATGGSCQGRIAMLLGDWALAEGTEAKECPVGDNPCSDPLLQNKPYYDMVKASYDVAINGVPTAGTSLATWTTGASPIDENQFWLSFRGELGAPPRKSFEEDVGGSHFPTDPYWVVTPGGRYSTVPEYDDAYNDRTNCFLGLKCGE